MQILPLDVEVVLQILKHVEAYTCAYFCNHVSKSTSIAQEVPPWSIPWILPSQPFQPPRTRWRSFGSFPLTTLISRQIPLGARAKPLEVGDGKILNGNPVTPISPYVNETKKNKKTNGTQSLDGFGREHVRKPKIAVSTHKKSKKKHIRNMCHYYFFCEGKLQFLDSGHVFLRDPSRDWVPCAFFFVCCLFFPEFSIWTYFDFFLSFFYMNSAFWEELCTVFAG